MKVQSSIPVSNSEIIRSTFEKKRENIANNTITEDGITISDSAKELAILARDKVSEFHSIRFSSIYGEIKEIPAKYKCENLFKLELKATSISGETSIFEKCSENQAMIFEQWIDENATDFLSADEIYGLKKQIGTIVSSVDNINSQEGYRGTSFESVFLLSTSEAGLKKINEMLIPKQLQNSFSKMISEYVNFNDKARNSIMERMTPDYMVVGIGTQNELYKYKAEIISGEQAFFKSEKVEVSNLCQQFFDGKMDKSLFYYEIKKYLKEYYENRYELRKQPEVAEAKANNMLNELQKMYGYIM